MPVRISPWKPCRPRNGNFLLEQFVVRLEVPIRNRPVDTDTILGVDTKIRRMESRRKRGPVHRAAAYSLAAVVRSQRQRMLAARDPQIVPVELVRSLLIADPFPFRIPEWPGFQSHDSESCARKPLQQNATRRSDSHNAVIDGLALSELPHGRRDALHRP
jgi:hypothetical protein